ncbi:unnamed protein product [Gongylonema pulchrum]|uniref:PAP_fibrillin domain-containing protein n=1 Tax=Gongylonema pulchrum TaxID=637853 RepID=A0A183EKM8_9BILA|nr:unnamed protein product [Gongylonema pulchrum]
MKLLEMLSLSLLLLHGGIIVESQDFHARQRRSNIPCGTSFTPCSRAPLAFGLATNTINDEEALAQRILSEAVGTFMDINKEINPRDVINAVREAKEEADILFNRTESDLFRSTNGLFFIQIL